MRRIYVGRLVQAAFGRLEPKHEPEPKKARTELWGMYCRDYTNKEL